MPAVLRPRVQHLLRLPLPLPRVVAMLRRQPELLGVDSAQVQARVDYMTGWVLGGWVLAGAGWVGGGGSWVGSCAGCAQLGAQLPCALSLPT